MKGFAVLVISGIIAAVIGGLILFHVFGIPEPPKPTPVISEKQETSPAQKLSPSDSTPTLPPTSANTTLPPTNESTTSGPTIAPETSTTIPSSSSSTPQPTPSASPSITPSSPQPTTSIVPPITARHLKKGETATVYASDFVVGDIFINGTKFCDDNPDTGLIVNFQVSVEISAPFEADIITVNNLPDKPSLIQERVDNEKLAHPIFVRIDVIEYKGDQTKPQATTLTPSPSSSQPTTSIIPPVTFSHLNENKSARVSANDFIVGDIYINGTKFCDDNSNTGLIVDFQVSATITAPYGADIITVNDLSDKPSLIEKRKNDEKLAHPNFIRIDVIEYLGNQTPLQRQPVK